MDKRSNGAGKWMIDRSCVIMLALLLGETTAAGEELFEFFEEEAQVVTATRRLQPAREAPVSVEVITQDEIRTLGVTNLWDVMRFRAGLDVIDGRSPDGNRGIVSVRGFPQDFVNNLQVLLDGRSVYSAYSGGVYWEQLPVQIQDIDRIEIVRGPNAALYGSNAGLGVIHIITRKPQSSVGASAEGVIGNRDAYKGSVSFESARDRYGLRLSYGYFTEDGYPTVSNPSFPPKDSLLSHKANFRGYLHPKEGTNLELYLGASWDDLGISFSRDAKYIQSFEMLKLEQTINQNSSFEILASFNKFEQTNFPNSGEEFKVRYFQYDVEGVHHIDWWEDRLKTTWGFNYRKSIVKSYQVFSPLVIDPTFPPNASNPRQTDELFRGFLHQTVDLQGGVVLVGAVSLEDTNSGGTEPAYSLTVLYRPDLDHSLRASYSLAPTIPNLFEKHANQITFPGFPPFVPAVANIGEPDIDPDIIQSYEVGYQGAYMARKLLAEMNLFYMDIDDLREGSTVFTGSVVVNTFSNTNRAIARGAEIKFAYWFVPGRSVYANYTYEHINDLSQSSKIRDFTPEHKLNLGAMAHLGYGWHATVNAGYKDNYISTAFNGDTAGIPAYWRLDARLAYQPSRNFEIFVGGRNLADSRHPESTDSLEVPRTYYAGLRMDY